MARDFNGSTQYLSYAGSLCGTPPFSMACWCRHDALVNYSSLFGCYSSTTNDTHRLLSDSSGNLWAQSYQAGGGASQKSGLTTGTWQHCAGVWSASNSRTAYVNGSAATTNTTSVTPTLNRTAIGYDWGGVSTGYYLNGQVAEAAIWGAALTAAEILSLAAGVSPRLIRPQSLLAHWEIVGKVSPEPDAVGGYAFTLNNTPTAYPHPRMMRRRPLRYPRIAPAVAGGAFSRIVGPRAGLAGPGGLAA